MALISSGKAPINENKRKKWKDEQILIIQSVMKELNTSYYDSIIANKKNIYYCDIMKTVTYSQSSCGNTGKATACKYNWIH